MNEQDLKLLPRFGQRKRKLTGREARYFPTMVTSNDAIKVGSRVMIASDPDGPAGFMFVTVKKISNGDVEETEFTVLLRDLSPCK